ncbi:MAG: hypothetical protein ACK4J0_00715 [Candidatus Anstonellaceae archaeon]
MAFAEPDVSKLKLKKSTFRFVQLKKYEPKKHFLIKKSPKTPLEEILSSLLGQKKKKESPPPVKQKFSLKTFVFEHKYIVGALLFIFVMLSFIFFSALTKPPLVQASPPSQNVFFQGALEKKVIDSGIISSGSLLNSSYQPFLILEYEPINLSELSLDAYFYPTPPSRQVFILDYFRDGADTYPEFRKKLEIFLKQNGWIINDISIDDLNHLPEGCTLIIPTGYLPEKLLGTKNYPSLTELSSRGIVVIYIGQPFDANVFDDFGNIHPPDIEKIKNLNIKFEKKALSSTDGFSLSSPYYTASFEEGAPNLLWGSLSVIYLNKGYLLIIPQALDGGWGGNSDLAAKDIGNLITKEPYRLVLSSLSYKLNNSKTSRISLFFNQTSQKKGLIRLVFTMKDKKNVSQKIFFDWPVEKVSNSNIYIDSSLFVPTYLGGQKKTITLVLNETPVEDVKLFFQLYVDGELKDSFPVEQGLTKTVVTRSSPVSLSLQPGTYLLKVVDSKGKLYSGYKIDIISININITGNDKRLSTAFKEGKFNISFSSNNRSLTVPYVKVSIENKKNARVSEFKNVNEFIYEPNIIFERGNYTFVFDFNGYIQKVKLEFSTPLNVWERTDVQILGVVALLSFGFVAYVLARPKKDLFSLDIPDFPFQEYKNIKISSKRVLEIFDIINKEFKWEGMPLSLSEIKNGFLKLTFDGHPIVIGEYNLEEILQKLEARKLVVSNLGFWIPTSWLNKTNIKKITLYRFLRDIFVNNAVKFSKLRSLEEEKYEVKIFVNNTTYYLFLFDGTYSFIKKIISQTHVGQCWVIFENQQDLNAFLEYISSSISKQFLLLKLYIHNGKIKLISLDEFEKIIQSIKIQ